MDKNYLVEYADYITQDLGKNNISQSLFKKFKEIIIEEKIPAGYMMPNENTVSELLGVGRSTLREAYTALEVFGFIRRSKAGTFINEIDDIVNMAPFSLTVSNSNLVDLMEFRYMLEGETASYAAKRANAKDIEQLTEIYENMKRYQNDIDQFIYYDQKFHTVVSQASHNQLLISTMTASREPFEKGVQSALKKSLIQNPSVMDVTIDLHGKILQAIKNGDYQTAYHAMREHISYVNLTVKYT